MDYFTDVYLKRVNRFGSNIQDRVHGKMTYDFENKLKKSVNKIKMYKFDDMAAQFGEAILQTKSVNEKETTSYLLTRVTENYNNGFLFYAEKPFSTEKQIWMVLFKEQYETIGYNRYIVVLLENEIEWIDNKGLIKKSFSHYIGNLDGKIKDQFKIAYDVAVATPSKTLSLVCPYNPQLTRDCKINIQGETWRVSGFDKISIPGIMYVTLEEDYVQKTELADQEELNNWSIISAQGLEVFVTNGQENKIDFYCSYKGANINEEIQLTTSDDIEITKVDFNSFSFSGAPGIFKLQAKLKNAPLVIQEFELTISDNKENWMAIVGPHRIKVLQTLEYTLNTSLVNYAVDITSENSRFEIVKTEQNKVYIQGKEIGPDNILITYNGQTFSTPLEVISPWM